MRWIASVLLGLICAMAFALFVSAQEAAPPTSLSSQSLAPLIEKTAPAVVNIYSRRIIHNRSAAHYLDGSAFWRLFRDALLFGYGQDRIESSLGSGVVVVADGVIVTNHHVVENAEDIVVALPSGQVYPAKVLVSDRRTDVAVLRIDTGGAALPTIEFGDSDRLKVGDRVISMCGTQLLASATALIRARSCPLRK
jgi:serine protease Do